MAYFSILRQGSPDIDCFCLKPSHLGKAGNGKADEAAKEAVRLGPSDVLIPHTDYRTNILENTKNFVNQNGMKKSGINDNKFNLW